MDDLKIYRDSLQQDIYQAIEQLKQVRAQQHENIAK